MDFRATPTNVVALLLVALGIYALISLSKEKRDSNMPMLFFIGILTFIYFTDRVVNRYLLTAGVAFALALRFEFMNHAMTRFVLMLEMAAVTAVAGSLVIGVFEIHLQDIGLGF